MRASILLGLLPLLGGCLDAGSGAVDPDAAFRGTIRIEAAPLNLDGVSSVLFDVGAGPDENEAGGTANLPAPHEPPQHHPGQPDSVSQLVYPRVTWAIPVHDAAGPICEDAALDLEGPITVTYTSDDAVAGTRYDHSAAPLVER